MDGGGEVRGGVVCAIGCGEGQGKDEVLTVCGRRWAQGRVKGSGDACKGSRRVNVVD